MGLFEKSIAAFKPSTIDPNSWKTVVVIAGIGTILEYYDFYCYSQLQAVLGKVFFPSSSPDAQALAYWGVFAIAFVARPLGAIIFGHIGDKYGRRWTFAIAIILMASSTFIIGILPTHSVGKYKAGIVAPILLAIMRFLQGISFAGDFGAAVVYISELADVKVRGRMVTTLQWTVNIGLTLASIVVIILQMLRWGWRIPFLLAAASAVLGYFMRRGLPETHAFLEEQREDEIAAHEAAGDREAAPRDLVRGRDSSPDASLEISTPPRAAKGQFATAKSADSFSSAAEEAEADARVKGVLTGLHGHSRSSVPVFRLLRNNAFGLIANLFFGAWIYAAFFVEVTWLSGQMINKLGVSPNVALGILIVGLLFNTAGLSAAGWGMDNGMRPITAGAITSLLGVAVGLGVYWWIGTSKSYLSFWLGPILLHAFIGFQMALVVLPMTRIYHPLERTTGFSFAYATGYGLLGGISPLVVTAIKSKLVGDAAALAPALWLLILSGGTLIGVILLKLYLPRLDEPYVGRIR